MNHDVKREKLTRDAQEAKRAANRASIENFRRVTSGLLEKNHKKEFDSEGIEFSSKCLEITPEYYTAWNYRKAYYLEKLVPNDNKQEIHEFLRKEITFSERSIQTNPKSYWVWHHRLMVCDWLDSQGENTDWRREVGLVSKLLKLDSRNFHGWTYRRQVCKRAGVGAKDELDYTTQLIKDNFSNYSAWHQRSLLLPQIHQNDPEAFRAAIEAEFEFVHQAWYTEPEDQSAWFYFRWLIQVVNPRPETIDQQLKVVDELLELEPNSRWALLTKALLIQKKEGKESEVAKKLFQQLIETDPTHSGYYRDFLSGDASFGFKST